MANSTETLNTNKQNSDAENNENGNLQKKELKEILEDVINDIPNIYKSLNLVEQKDLIDKLKSFEVQIKNENGMDEKVESVIFDEKNIELIKNEPDMKKILNENYILKYKSSSLSGVRFFFKTLYSKLLLNEGYDIIYLDEVAINNYIINNIGIMSSEEEYNKISEAIVSGLREHINNKIQKGQKVKFVIGTGLLFSKNSILSFSELSKIDMELENDIMINFNMIFLHPEEIEIKPEIMSVLNENKYNNMEFKLLTEKYIYSILKHSKLLVDKEVKVIDKYGIPTDIIMNYLSEKLIKLNKMIKTNTGKKILSDFIKNQLEKANVKEKFNNFSFTLLYDYLNKENILDLKDSINAKLLFMIKEKIKKKLIGQDNLIDNFFEGFYQYMNNESEKSKRPYNLLLTGPTGVGKTYFIKLLAKELGRKFIRYDMAEFKESHTASTLLGSPAGYVGYGSSDTIAKKLAKEKHSIVLFDEMEKAHPDVLISLLSLLDEGVITDREGNIGTMKNGNLIFFTTNMFRNKDEIINLLNTGIEDKNEDNGKNKGDNMKNLYMIIEILDTINLYSIEDNVKIIGRNNEEIYNDYYKLIKDGLGNKIDKVTSKQIDIIKNAIKELNLETFLGYNTTEDNASKDFENYCFYKMKEITKQKDVDIKDKIIAMFVFWYVIKGSIYSRLNQYISEAIIAKGQVPSEFVGRIDQKLLFNDIKESGITKIIELEFEQILKSSEGSKNYDIYVKTWEIFKDTIINSLLANKQVKKLGGRGIKNELNNVMKNYIIKVEKEMLLEKKEKEEELLESVYNKLNNVTEENEVIKILSDELNLSNEDAMKLKNKLDDYKIDGNYVLNKDNYNDIYQSYIEIKESVNEDILNIDFLTDVENERKEDYNTIEENIIKNTKDDTKEIVKKESNTKSSLDDIFD